MSGLRRAAEQLAGEWAEQQRTQYGSREFSLAEYVLSQLADPRSDRGDLVEDLVQRRWTVGTVAVVATQERQRAGPV